MIIRLGAWALALLGCTASSGGSASGAPQEVIVYYRRDPDEGLAYMHLNYSENLVLTASNSGSRSSTFESPDRNRVDSLFPPSLVEIYLADSAREKGAHDCPEGELCEPGEPTAMAVATAASEPSWFPGCADVREEHLDICPPWSPESGGLTEVQYRIGTFTQQLPTGARLPHTLIYWQPSGEEGRSDETNHMLATLESIFMRHGAP